MKEFVEEYRDAYVCDLCEWGSCIITLKKGKRFITDPFQCAWINVAKSGENPRMKLPQWKKLERPILIKMLKEKI